MNTPEWLKPGIYGAVIGAVFVGVVGFTWGGWVTGGTANDRAMAMSRDDVVASMVPVCLDMARSDPARADKLATIRAASTYQRRDALMDSGLGDDAGNRRPGPGYCAGLSHGIGTVGNIGTPAKQRRHPPDRLLVLMRPRFQSAASSRDFRRLPKT
jgi:hypothetical protein